MKIKTVAVLFVALMMFFSFSVTAVSEVKLSVGEEFYVFSENADEVSKATGKSVEEITDYCNSQGIVFLAVNEANTKQIKASCKKTKFSEQVGNISLLTENEIEDIALTLIGDEGQKDYEIKEKNSQKFIFTKEALKDSGGEYSYITYFTVANSSIYTLSFSTSAGESEDYAEDVFSNFECDDFLKVKTTGNGMNIALTVIASAVGIWVLYTLIRDLRKDKNTRENSLKTIDE